MSVRPRPFSFFLTASFAIAMATLAVAADPIVHTVKKGETLYAIARQYDISVDLLMKANEVSDAGRLFVGMKLTIPGSQAPAPVAHADTKKPAQSTIEYTVTKGDTLYSIAKLHNVSVDSIVRSSGMAGTTIKVGQVLKIPSATGSKSSAEPPSPAIVPKAPSSPATPATPAAAKAWPVQGTVSYLQGKLKGVSIVAEPSTAILAIRSGTVISAGPFQSYGLVAFVQSADKLIYVYGGAGSLSVRLGDSVRKGSMIGKVASEREAAAYFFVFDGVDTVDPNSVPRD